MLVVPDVHGREFWFDPLLSYRDEGVIFLGDYLDPYPDEGISKEDSIRVLRDILRLKNENPNRITLLLGNHDFMYFSHPFIMDSVRHDLEHHSEIRSIFMENFDSFSLVTSMGDYIFSHSGIHPGWLKRHPEFGNSVKDSVDILNTKIKDPHLETCLNEYSMYRGGYEYSIGSPVWSDVREWIDYPLEDEGITQVFGHTQLKEGKIIERPGFLCIDCKRVIRLNDNKIEIL